MSCVLACVRACVRKTQLTLKKPFYYEGYLHLFLLNVPLSKNLAILIIAKIVKILRRISFLVLAILYEGTNFVRRYDGTKVVIFFTTKVRNFIKIQYLRSNFVPSYLRRYEYTFVFYIYNSCEQPRGENFIYIRPVAPEAF